MEKRKSELQAGSRYSDPLYSQNDHPSHLNYLGKGVTATLCPPPLPDLTAQPYPLLPSSTTSLLCPQPPPAPDPAPSAECSCRSPPAFILESRDQSQSFLEAPDDEQ